jgi:phosphatidylethanolamine N-methyltransferase
MDRGLSTSTQIDDEGLRERNVASQSASTLSPEALTATGDVEFKDKANNDSKTFGRTPDGTGK